MGIKQKTNTANNFIETSPHDIVQESNIIPFPIVNPRAVGVPVEYLPQQVKDYHFLLKYDLVEKWVGEISDYLNDTFINDYGLPRRDIDRFDSDIKFLENTIRAMFYRNFEMEHPLHTYLNTARKVKNEETGEENYVYGEEYEEENTE